MLQPPARNVRQALAYTFRMRVLIVDWAGQAARLLADAGYVHSQEVTVGSFDEILSLVTQLWDHRLNVMIMRSTPATHVIVAVDIKSFQGR